MVPVNKNIMFFSNPGQNIKISIYLNQPKKVCLETGHLPGDAKWINACQEIVEGGDR